VHEDRADHARVRDKRDNFKNAPAVRAAHASETLFEVAAIEELVDRLADGQQQIPELIGVARRVDLLELLVSLIV